MIGQRTTEAAGGLAPAVLAAASGAEYQRLVGVRTVAIVRGDHPVDIRRREVEWAVAEAGADTGAPSAL